MIALNYHRVSSVGKPDFYSLDSEVFRQQLNLLEKSNFSVVDPDRLIEQSFADDEIMLHFDDGTEDHFTVAHKELVQRGLRGMFFVSTAKIGSAGYLSVDQLREMSAAGHWIESHGHSHRIIREMNDEQLRHELTMSMQLIQEWTGRTPLIYAPPGGFYQKSQVAIINSCGYRGIRTMHWGQNIGAFRGLIKVAVVSGSTTIDQLTAWLGGKGLWQQSLRYYGKSAIRACIPLALYVKLRNGFFSRDKSNGAYGAK